MEYLVAAIATLVLIALRELVRYGVWKASKQMLIAVIAANAAGYVFAAAVAFGVFAVHGTSAGYHTVIDKVLPGYDATTKLQAGDVILAVDHEALDDVVGQSLTERVRRKNGAAVILTIERAGATSDVSVTPTPSMDPGPPFVLGIMQSRESIQTRDVSAAARNAAVFPATYVRMIASRVGALFGGDDEADPGGPKRILVEYTVAPPSFLVRMGQHWMRFAVFAMLLMFVVDVIRVVRLSRVART